MDLKLYTKGKFASENRYQSTDKSISGGEFSRMYSHSMAGQQEQHQGGNEEAYTQAVNAQRKPEQTAALLALEFQKLTLEAATQLDEVRQANGIPQSPNKILFDQQGKPGFPNDYPFGEQLAAAIKQNPELEQLLMTLSAQAVPVTQTTPVVGMAAPINPPVSDASAKAKFEQMVRLSAARGAGGNSRS